MNTTARRTRTAAAKPGTRKRTVAAEMAAPATVTATVEPIETRVDKLTKANVDALRAYVPVDSRILGGTFAIFTGDVNAALKLVGDAQTKAGAEKGTTGGPYKALHAVIRKLNALAVTDAKTAAKPAPKQPVATKPAPKKAAAKPNGKPAPKGGQTPAQRSGLADTAARAAKAAQTNAEAKASGETRTCEGACGETKAITSFPTTGRDKSGVMKRGKVCRACRDAKKKAAK